MQDFPVQINMCIFKHFYKAGLIMNIYQKLIEVRKTVPYLKKDKTAGLDRNNKKTPYSYTYISGSTVIGAIRDAIDNQGLLLTTEVIEMKTEDIQLPKKNHCADEDAQTITEKLIHLKMKYTWINAEKPEEKIEILWESLGQNKREKGFGCALTYGERYFLLKFFNIPTDDLDPDEYFDDGDKLKQNFGEIEKSIKENCAVAHPLKNIEQMPIDKVFLPPTFSEMAITLQDLFSHPNDYDYISADGTKKNGHDLLRVYATLKDKSGNLCKYADAAKALLLSPPIA